MDVEQVTQDSEGISTNGEQIRKIGTYDGRKRRGIGRKRKKR